MLYGYGENALTLILLGTHVEPFVRALDLGAPTDTRTGCYRASFGRRAASRKATETQGRSARAEFDAIGAPAAATYLIETLALAERHVRRHRVVRHHVDAWRARPPGSWPTWSPYATHRDAEGCTITARLSAEGVAVPEEGTQIANTLQHTLSRLANAGPVRDVVIFVHTGVGARRRRARA